MAKRLLSPALCLAVCVLSIIGCLLLYRYDNKYTAPGPQAKNGILLLDEQTLAAYPVTHLVQGWEYYGGRLLSPKDFQEARPLLDAYVFIGQYGGLEGGLEGASPHGSASYRLFLRLPATPRSYTLELPEIFSAYRLYLNGALLAGMGDPAPETYRPETGNRSVSFTAAGQVELLIAVSDHSHLYSGMVYPPAFGLSEAVQRLMSLRLLLRGIFCAAAATVGLLSAFLGTAGRGAKAPLWYGLLCLCYVGFIGYPILKAYWSGYGLSYAVENLSFCAMLLLTLLLQRTVCPPTMGRDRGRAFLLFGGAMCGLTLLVHALLPKGSLGLMRLYSHLVMLYEWATALYITAASFRAAYRREAKALPLLMGILVFDCALVMDRLYPLYEPIISGWFVELAGFLLVLCIGVAIGQEIALQFRERAILQDRAGQQSYEALSGYIAQYGQTVPAEDTVVYAKNRTLSILAQYYTRLAEQEGIALTMRLTAEETLGISDAELCTLVSNLLENAMEACLRAEGGARDISFTLQQQDNTLSIHMRNTVGHAGQAKEGFPSAKRTGGKAGYGLLSVQAIAKQYQGEAAFRRDEEKGLFYSTVHLVW